MIEKREIVLIKLSVIIPVYNVESYLSECIESVLNQKFHGELEIILVNDGSTDESPSICDSYGGNDYRIKVIHQENGGLSSARNAGIMVATGYYIAFLDSDDFWIDDTIYRILDVAEKTFADIILGNAIRYLDDTCRFSEYPNNIDNNPNCQTTEDKILDILDPCNRFQWHVWKCIYKTEFIKNNNLYFKKGLLFEDVEWLPRVFSLAKSFELVDIIFVCYRYQRPNSITVDPRKSIRRQMDMLKVIHSLARYFKEVEMDKELKKIYYINLSETYVYIFLRQALLKDEKSKIMLKKLVFYMSYYQGKYAKTLKLMIKALGYNNTCRMLNKIGRVKLRARGLK